MCLGEIVCQKRAPATLRHYDTVMARLEAAHKEVIHSTPIMVVDDRDLALVERAAARGGLVEANDVAALAIVANRTHAIGPYVNVYNPATLAQLADRGAVRVTLPIELPLQSVGALAKLAVPAVEVQVFGRWPLAISARCYHARAYGRSKDACQFACGEDPSGLAVTTLDDQPFVTVNGVQTLSSSCGCLVRELPSLLRLGVALFRLAPEQVDMVAVARAFRNLLDGSIDSLDALHRIQALVPMALSNGFLHGREGALLV